jgi:hypothetical protein
VFSNGSCDITVNETGTYTVSASGSGFSTSASVTVAAFFNTYSTSLTLSYAILNISTDEASLFSKQVTATSGSTVLTGTFSSSGICNIYTNVIGTWSISASDGTNTATASAEVSTLNHNSVGVELAFYRIYGVDIDFSNSNPETSVTYTDSAVGMTPGSDDWDTIFGHYPCVFKDGTELYKLNRNDYTKKADGSNADITTLGNDVMVCFPKRGYKIWSEGNIVHVRMTTAANLAGYCYKPFSRTSLGDRDKFYYGAYKAYNSNSKLYSSSGKTPTGNVTRANFRTYAANRGTGYAQNGWYQLIYLQVLYILKFKNLNSQAAVGYGYVKSSHSAAVNTGGANTFGMDMQNASSTQKTSQDSQVKCLGIEDFWGNIWQWVDGVNTDGSRNLWTCFLPGSFSDTYNASNFVNQGQMATSNISGWTDKVQGTTDAGFLQKATSGSDSTYCCDNGYVYASCIACFGGHWNYALNAGVWQLFVFTSSSSASATIGSRLMYV